MHNICHQIPLSVKIQIKKAFVIKSQRLFYKQHNYYLDINCLFHRPLCQSSILILKIPECISAVKILLFLGPGRKTLFFVQTLTIKIPSLHHAAHATHAAHTAHTTWRHTAACCSTCIFFRFFSNHGFCCNHKTCNTACIL